jgi:hypothetical protein
MNQQPSSARSMGGQPRVPLALQQIFEASQRGEEVHEAPKNGLGFRIFKRPFGRKSKKLQTKQAAVLAPRISSLHSERSVKGLTAADASRKAMQNKEKEKEQVRNTTENENRGTSIDFIRTSLVVFPHSLMAILSFTASFR